MQINKSPSFRDWHRWFAWHPVSISEDKIAWLEYVERQGEFLDAGIASCWFWRYRAAIREGGK